MQSLIKTTTWAVVAIAVTGAAATPMGRVSMSFPSAASANATITEAVKAAASAAAVKQPAATVAKLAVPVAKLAVPVVKSAATLAFEQSLRSQLKYETVQWDGKPMLTLDEPSRILLTKAAAKKAGLQDVGLTYHDVYGVIEAETSWVQRLGASKDGTANLGLAQFEPETAARLGVVDPSDPVQAVLGAATYMKQSAKWANSKLAALKLSPEERAAKVREGVSVHYNLSVKGRNKWDGLNTADLPVETQRHIRNARAGAAEAVQLAKLLKT